uniref:RNA helicase n=1 Tax=Ascaris lumbricoides TaxID=6252 RepID=A0A0M3ICF1_ASCLU
MDLLATKLLQFLFQGGELELEEPRSKYERYKDASGRWVTSRSGDARPVKIGAKGPYVVAEKKKFDEEAHLKAGDYFEDLFNAEVTISGPGENVPVLRTFEEMRLAPSLMENLSRKKYERPLPVQQVAFSLISLGSRHDVIAHAPTGSGKTAAFLLPIINSIVGQKTSQSGHLNKTHPYCMIISPTKELAEQLYRDADGLVDGTNCKVVLTFGGMSRSEDIKNIHCGCDIVIGSVGRLCDFIVNKILKVDSLKFIVFDEADKLLESNLGFGDEIKRELLSHIPSLVEMQKLLFSATDIAQLENFAKEVLRCSPTKLIVGGLNAVSSFVDQYVLKVHQGDKHVLLLRLMRDQYGYLDNTTPKIKTIIFVNTKRRCSVVACFLSLQGFKAYPVHGNLTMALRRKGVDALLNDECHILVATDVLARGMDLKDVSHVINYDVPNVESWASYVHRVGRTGRLGNRGRATTFYSPETDSAMALILCEVINYDVPNVESWASYVHRVGRTGRLGNRGRATTFYSPETDSAMALILCEWLRMNKQSVPQFLEREAIAQAGMQEWHLKAIEKYESAMKESDRDEEFADYDDSSEDEFCSVND